MGKCSNLTKAHSLGVDGGSQSARLQEGAPIKRALSKFSDSVNGFSETW